MGILNLSVSSENYTQEGETSGFLVHEIYDTLGARDIRLIWSTEFGSDTWQKEFVVGATVYGYRKGTSQRVLVGIYADTWDASECNEATPYGDGGRYWWSHSLAIGSLLPAILTGGNWTYANRKYDSIDFQLNIYSNFNDGYEYNDSTKSETARLDFSIGFCPKYTITGARYQGSDTLVITYSTTWTRKDDRFWLSNKESEDGGQCLTADGEPLLSRDATGTVTAKGRIDVPVSSLTRHVYGESIYLNIAFNAMYRPSGLFFARATATVNVSWDTTCSTPTLTLVSSGETTVLQYGDSGDDSTPCESATVKMADSRYSIDQATVDVGDTVEFAYPPIGVDTAFTAVGSNSLGATSTAFSLLVVPADSTDAIAVIDSMATGERVSFTEYQDSMGPEVSAVPDVETYKLAGRSRPSSFYGTGGTTDVSFAGVLYKDDATKIESMAYKGDFMCRFPDGRRYAITPQVDIERSNERVVFVEVSGSEVDL